jgi:hypothetical protein
MDAFKRLGRQLSGLHGSFRRFQAPVASAAIAENAKFHLALRD